MKPRAAVTINNDDENEAGSRGAMENNDDENEAESSEVTMENSDNDDSNNDDSATIFSLNPDKYKQI